ncbi:unnamed protein product [Aspergillus oryzae]|uniref:Unnamed protein product n=2 Tax=Aspergillus oryzae TaxID=5062 RepID=A0AAN5BW07_ASPOZ|nr:unnamed protein product [Aspergillus oryzae]GMF95178.1 unnamed protein product [Aspergillus oryzae]GMG12441.1 unnamed protein product [Aspergillus oryzae]GMG35589.1 unnamed protein product [Aspergillus oryzae]GMG50550.1 unnamed protein product [Aspergillus oryzae var. brunneus]
MTTQNDPPGDPKTLKSQILETGAAAVQDFTPVKQICAHLNAFHVYVDDPTRCVEANHYCSHITEGIVHPYIQTYSPQQSPIQMSYTTLHNTLTPTPNDMIRNTQT